MTREPAPPGDPALLPGGAADDATCIDGWVSDLGPLLPPGDRDFARQLLRYYVPEVLRAPPGKVASRCGARKGPESVR